MVRLHALIHALLGSIVVAEGWYIHELTSSKQRELQVVRSEALAQAVPARATPILLTGASAQARPTKPVLLAPAPCPSPGQAAKDELERRRALESSAAQAAHEQQVRQSRETVAQRLSLGGTELASLEAAGDALRDAEGALRERLGNGEVPDTQLNQELNSLWSSTEADIERLLGRERFADFSALRKEHPELGRSLYVFRSGPGDSR